MVAPRSAGPPAATRRTGLPQVCPSMQKKVLGRVSAGAAAASAWLLSLMAASIGAALAFGNAPAGGGGWRWACRAGAFPGAAAAAIRSEEHTSELQSLMRISYAVFCLKKKKRDKYTVEIESTNSEYNT